MEAMDQPAGSPGTQRPGEGGDGSMEPGTCQELLHRLRELEVGHGAGCEWTFFSALFTRLKQRWTFPSRSPLRSPLLALTSPG